MANTIILKRSATPSNVPTTGQLALGEIGINTYDGKLFIKKDNGTASVVQIGGVTSVNSETGAVTLTTDDISESGQTNKWASAATVRGHLSGTGAISYNSGTGAFTTTQTLTTAGTPTFAGLTLTGGMGITGHILPAANITYDLGSASYQWRDIYVGPGSLYVNGSKVLEDVSGTITFSADQDENIRIKTVGAGILQLGSSAQTGVIQVDSTLQITGGKQITDSAGIEVNFGDDIDMNGNKVVGLGAPSSANDAATKTYVDTSISAISTSSITQGNSNVTVTDSGTGTVTVSVDGSTALTVSATGVTVAGNLTVSGATTTVESNTISLADNIITLNSDASGSATQNAGVEVERGDDANVSLRWDEGINKWGFTNDGSVFTSLALDTDGLTEGTTNQYHTSARARGALSAGTGITYSSATGVIATSAIPNASLTNSSTTIGTTAIALGASSTTLAGLTSVASTGFTGALTGNASTATTLATARAIQGVNFDGSAAITVVTAGTGISVSGTAVSTSAIPNASLTNSTITIGSTSTALGATSTTLAGLTSVTSTTFVGALTGNASTSSSTSGNAATVTNGVYTTDTGTVTSTMIANDTIVNADINSAAAIVDTKLATIATAGKVSNSATTAASANTASAIVARDASGNFAAGTITAALTGNVTGNTSGTHTGAVVGNASTATSAAAWTTARTITLGGDLSGNVSIDGSANVTLTATVTADATALGTDTTGNYVAAGAVSGSGLSGSASSEGATFTVTSNATNANTASTIVFRDASGNFSAGTISAALTGNASTATTAGTVTTAAQTAITSVGTLTALTVSGATATGALTVTGSITASGEITAYFSDERLKMDISPIQGALNKVMAIGGYTYKANELAHTLGVSRYDNQIGLLAGEVEAVMPELVTESGLAGYKTIRYDKVVSVLVEAIKEQQAMIEELRRDVKKTLH